MKLEIKNRWSGQIIYQDEAESFKALVIVAIKSGADLRGADLHGANLRGADLHGADLRGANLHGVNLHGANLRGVNLYGVDLHGANLHGVNLHGVNLSGAQNISEKLKAETLIVPETGGFQGWKMCREGVIVRLRIPASAKRS